MTRRELFVTAVGVLAAARTPDWRRYGAITPNIHYHLAQQGVFLRVYHRGVDVTHGCTFADPATAVAHQLLRNQRGNYYIDLRTGEAAMRVLDGVTIRPGAPFEA